MNKFLAAPVGRRAALYSGARGLLGLWAALRLGAAAGALESLAGCYKAPGTARDQFIYLSPEKEIEMGVKAFRDMLRSAPLSTNPEVNDLVHRVGRRIAVAELIVHRVTDCDKPRLRDKLIFGRVLREGVRISKGHINVTKAEILQDEPANLIRIFDDAQKYRCRLSHETRELVRSHLHLIDDEFRRSATANQPFFSILKWKDSVYETLVEMHRAGVLGAFIPEFNHLLCMVLHDAYHTYTVDEHSLMLIQEIERLRAGNYESPLPLLTQIARYAEKIELLYLGMMFHDIGKGFGGGHSEIGANLVPAIARRMKLNAVDGALVEFLVRHHLLMTHTAFRRDLEDERTIFEFAKTMGTVNNLKMLYLLTFADVKAVGPDVWNPWKASLLGELYVKTLNLLEEAGETSNARRRSPRTRDCCRTDRPAPRCPRKAPRRTARSSWAKGRHTFSISPNRLRRR